jgi:hypothetical protein
VVSRLYELRNCRVGDEYLLCFRRVALGLSAEHSNEERAHYSQLLRECNRVELITDDLYIMDVLSVSDDTSYFVFDVRSKSNKTFLLLFSQKFVVGQYERSRIVLLTRLSGSSTG